MAKASATIGVNGAGFQRGLENMRKQANKFGSDIKGTIAGAFAFGAVAAFFSKFASEMDRVGKLATRLGETTDAIQQIGGAAEMKGADLEQVVKALTKIEIEARKGGETFKAAGIAQEEFVGATSQRKLVMLAEAYQAAGSDQEKMLAIMQLLGNRAQDLIPLLKQGPDALRESMEGIPVVSNQVVRAMEILNDTITTLGKNARVAFGSVIGVLQQAGVFVGTLLTGGSFEDAMIAIANLDKSAEEFAANQRARANMPPMLDPAALREAARIQEEIAKAQADVEKTLRERSLDRMSIEDRIAELKREQEEAAARMEAADTPEIERVEAMKKVLELEKQIEQAREQQARAGEAAAREQQQAQERLAKARSDLAAEEDRQMLAGLDPAERARILQERQAGLMAESQSAGERGDELTAAEKKLEALQLQDSINRALDEAIPKQEAESSSSRSVISSSLASVGGGGGSFVSGFDPQVRELREQTALLRQLVDVAMMEQQSPSRTQEVF